MIEKIIDYSIKNRFLVILMTLFVIAGGVYAMFRTPLDAIPDLSDVQVIIFTEYPGQNRYARLIARHLRLCSASDRIQRTFKYASSCPSLRATTSDEL